MSTYRIYGKFTTKSPLSHIGEAISTCSYLVQEPILQKDGSIEEIFCYNGNAWRGQLRDLCANYLLDKLGIQISLDAFHLLYSGGKIGGDQSVDVEQAKFMREVIPMLSLFGGGIGNQILAGKMKVGNSYPLCVEALPVLSHKHHEQAENIDYADLTFEKSFTRFDDSKNLGLQDRVLESDLPKLTTNAKKKAKKSGDVSTQMRMTSELLIAGATLAHEIDLVQVSEVELGALVAGLVQFAQTPYIGGQSNKGHGRVDYVSKIVNMETGEEHNLVWVHDDMPKLSDTAQQAKDAYDTHLVKLHDSFIQNNNTDIQKMLGASDVAD